MSFDNLKKIYQFSENSHKEDYWKDMFGSNEKAWFSHPSASIKNSDAFPACDFYLFHSRYYIDIELPGIDMHQLSIHLNNNLLCIEGYYQTIITDCAYLLKERQHKHFIKNITIPNYVNQKEIDKKYDNGILQLSFPYKEKEGK
ncbi:Hsp20/alpha crystallin family protein [Niallia circulans]|uniref:Hsp20/alpha crystallin family protein n=1 Tax=Niallia circulans TaxID=1397 RepID=UPI00155F8911|nr:Hsp20/alpha crystallin family protein [Niallia circulans]NRG34348.1 Hsp20/alpha crystallin family protein [Niallia circulans]